MKIRLKNIQRAQGMVEFALVLPILLLVILGIFAFGHLFFTYSSVVSASREAARWGSASGISTGTTQRYRDCNGIRAAAVRVGSFAGVDGADGPDDANVDGIYIGFDHGPNDPNPDFDTCVDDVGPDPAAVGYGDRIKVRVTVLYRPIVPIVNLPTFHLTATTARTIVKSIPVGDSEAAEISCPTTAIRLLFFPNPVPPGAVPPYEFAIVNQQIDVNVQVTSSDLMSPTGTVDIVMPYVDPLGKDHIATCQVNSNSDPAGRTCTLVKAGDFTAPTAPDNPLTVTATYNPITVGGQCYASSTWTGFLKIAPAETITTITAHKPDPSFPSDPADDPNDPKTGITVSVTVDAVKPGIGYPSLNNSSVTVTDLSGHKCRAFLTNGAGSCQILIFETTTLYATYNGEDPSYKDSTSAGVLHTVILPATPTPTRTATPFGMATMTATPTRTATPVTCPRLKSGMDFSITDSIQFEITNPGNQTNIESVDLSWPSYPETRLRDARFGSQAEVNDCKSKQYCLWEAPDPLNGLTPAQKTISPFTPNWSTQADAIAKNADMFMRLYFNGALPSGGANYQYDYLVTIHFRNGCVLEVPGQH